LPELLAWGWTLSVPGDCQMPEATAISAASSSMADLGMAAGAEQQERVLVIDFGSQVSHLICRRVREAGVYCELRSCLLKAADVRNFAPTGLVLSGGPHSVYDAEGPHLAAEIWALIDEQQLPVLGICYGLQEMCHALGGKVEPGAKREFGHAHLHVRQDVCVRGASDVKKARGVSPIFQGVAASEQADVPVWMSHGDKVTSMPAGFVSVAHTSSCENAAVQNLERRLYGVQFHPEVTHTPCGAQLIKNFVVHICGCKGEWTMHDFAAKQATTILSTLGDKYCVGAVSGGVDSSVAAALLHRAIGDRFRPFLVDTGLLRKDEAS